MLVLRGLPASKGTASGPVRIATSPEEFAAFLPGEILVTKMTSPDWVAFFDRAAAIVTEQGGVLCHAAIVSRELGLPCVVGVRNAVASLKTGMQVLVSGSTGEIIVLADQISSIV